jgi:peptide chain release factor 2
VRISPFDANKRRHTSFSAVFVYPEIEEDVKIDINDDDIRIDTYRASGAGGQHVNKTSSAIRITHLPTGTVVTCQNERSQHKNKAMAMKILKAKLYDLNIREQEKRMEGIVGDKRDIAWGSQIRSYVLQPYRMVKDHRNNLEVGNVDAVLDGGIDIFIDAYLRRKVTRG